VVWWMRARAITTFFEVPGESFLPVLNALRDEPSIELVTMRHESGASFAADAYAKLSGRPAVCMATRGPGASNLSIGVQTAFYDGTPMIALLGLVPRHLQGSRAFQEFDPTSLFASISKAVLTVNHRESLCDVLDQALAIAMDPRPGPVVVGLPSDVLVSLARDRIPEGPPAKRPSQQADISGVAELMASASSVAVLAATEAQRGETAQAICAAAELLGAPVFCSWRRFSAFDNGAESFAGSLGLGASPETIDNLMRAELIVCFGDGLDQITCDTGRLNRSGLRILRVSHRADSQLSRRLQLPLVVQYEADPGHAAASIAAWLRARPEVTHAVGTPARRAARPPTPRETPGSGMRMSYLMPRVNAALPHNAVVVSDAGNFAQWMLRHVTFDRDRIFLGALNGAMGYGLPGGIGAQLASSLRPCWVLAGDGGLLMTSAEMETAARMSLDLVCLVFDNSMFGTIRAKQEEAYPGRPSGTVTGAVDFAGLARALGWTAWAVEREAGIEAALAEAGSSAGCRLVHFKVDPHPLALAALPDFLPSQTPGASAGLAETRTLHDR
jgi:acetolactate synthase I/II/III large subunit